jgi:hypothetical protein
MSLSVPLSFLTFLFLTYKIQLPEKKRRRKRGKNCPERHAQMQCERLKAEAVRKKKGEKKRINLPQTPRPHAV